MQEIQIYHLINPVNLAAITSIILINLQKTFDSNQTNLLESISLFVEYLNSIFSFSLLWLVRFAIREQRYWWNTESVQGQVGRYRIVEVRADEAIKRDNAIQYLCHEINNFGRAFLSHQFGCSVFMSRMKCINFNLFS